MAAKDLFTASAGPATVPAFGTTMTPAPVGMPPGATRTLRTLVTTHNAIHGDDQSKRADMRAMRAVYRRGANASSGTASTRRQAGTSRVREQLATLATGTRSGTHTRDNDLLPRTHPLAPGPDEKGLSATLLAERKGLFDEALHPRNHGRFSHSEGAGGVRDAMRSRSKPDHAAADAALHDRLIGGTAGHLPGQDHLLAQMLGGAPKPAESHELAGAADGGGRDKPDHLSDPELHAAHASAVADLAVIPKHDDAAKAAAEVRHNALLREIGERGIGHANGGGDDPNASTRTSAVHSLDALKKVEVAEPQVTSDLLTASHDRGGTMVGTENRMKTHASLTRKVRDKAEQKGVPQEQYAGSVADALRYTSTLPHEEFTEGVHGMLGDLQAKGHSVEKLDNFWGKGNIYQGTHADMRGPTGQKYELQFHTADSFAAKTANHKDYEAFRGGGLSDRRMQVLSGRMSSRQSKVEVPSGAESIRIPEASKTGSALTVGLPVDRHATYSDSDLKRQHAFAVDHQQDEFASDASAALQSRGYALSPKTGKWSKPRT